MGCGQRPQNDKHGASASEAEQVFFDDRLLVAPDSRRSDKEPRLRALGQTIEGRLLHVTFTLREKGTRSVLSPHATRVAGKGKLMKTRARTFKSEAQERAYWESHDSAGEVDWSKAERVRLPNLKPTTQSISLRLPMHTLERIKAAAHVRDVPYQSLIKVWLEEKLSA